MRLFFRNTGIFIFLFAAVWIALGIALAQVPQQELHLWLNQHHGPAADIFFRYYTLIAEYGIYVAVAALLFYKAGDALFLLISELLAGGVCQIIKHIVRAPRPALVFDIANNPDALPLVEGVKMHLHNSFPSGHSSTFFVLFFGLLLIYSNSSLNLPNDNYPDADKRLYKKSKTRQMVCQVLCFVFALLGAYSRIYLSQHFAADIFAGGLIGLTITFLVYLLFQRLDTYYGPLYAKHICVHKRQKAA